MDGMSESSEEESNKICESQMGFINILRDFPILLSKSQTLAVRLSKSKAVELIKKQWALNYGSEITTNQLYKKINNMKSRLKKKTDINRTGNKKIILLDWEKVLIDIMEGDTNPVLTKVPGALSVGVELPKSNHDDPIPTPSTSASEMCTANRVANIDNEDHQPKKRKHNKVSPLEKYETDVTMHLSNNELQRLVLLKQLKVLEMKEEKLKRQLNLNGNEESTLNNNNSNIVHAEDGKAFLEL
ncbi:unnamed protein product [Ceutorhynchus assimilis]|uniref:Uncharacterized protein n=1 Tax=Ceutorhynchus assimilis TaxID=467358 RepID=A0A9N9MBL7_9CUCU|nr:unnamed protein product [Ceutorhynchus assimilis]